MYVALKTKPVDDYADDYENYVSYDDGKVLSDSDYRSSRKYAKAGYGYDDNYHHGYGYHDEHGNGYGNHDDDYHGDGYGYHGDHDGYGRHDGYSYHDNGYHGGGYGYRHHGYKPRKKKVYVPVFVPAKEKKKS